MDKEELEKILRDKIHECLPKLVKILNEYEVYVGATAMIHLLTANYKQLNYDKDMFLNLLSDAWDQYVRIEDE